MSVRLTRKQLDALMRLNVELKLWPVGERWMWKTETVPLRNLVKKGLARLKYRGSVEGEKSYYLTAEGRAWADGLRDAYNMVLATARLSQDARRIADREVGP